MSESETKALHISGLVAFESDAHRITGQVPLPVVLYLTEEIMLDDGFSDEALAGLLHRDLVFAVGHFRTRLRKSREEIERPEGGES